MQIRGPHLDAALDLRLQLWQRGPDAARQRAQRGAPRARRLGGGPQPARAPQGGGYRAQHQRVQHQALLRRVHRPPQVEDAAKVERRGARLARLRQQLLAVRLVAPHGQFPRRRQLRRHGGAREARHLTAERRPLEELARLALGAAQLARARPLADLLLGRSSFKGGSALDIRCNGGGPAGAGALLERPVGGAAAVGAAGRAGPRGRHWTSTAAKGQCACSR
jgi:hypothetical protein